MRGLWGQYAGERAGRINQRQRRQREGSEKESEKEEPGGDPESSYEEGKTRRQINRDTDDGGEDSVPKVEI